MFDFREYWDILQIAKSGKNERLVNYYKAKIREANRKNAYAEPQSISEALKNGKSVIFYRNNGESQIEYTAYSKPITDDELQEMEILSPYGCTGQIFTVGIDQAYSSALNMWVVKHHKALDI